MLQIYLTWRAIRAVLGNWLVLVGIAAVVGYLLLTGALADVVAWIWSGFWAVVGALVSAVLDWLAAEVADRLNPFLVPG